MTTNPPLTDAELAPEAALALAEGALWILVDREDCPGRDSRELGPVAPDRVAGRIAFTVPF